MHVLATLPPTSENPLLHTRVNSPCVALIDACAKNGSLLVDLLGVLERAGDDVGYFVDVRDRDRVRGARDFHGLRGPRHAWP